MRSGVVPDIILIRFRFLCPQSSFALVQFLLLFYSLRGFLFYFLQIASNSQQCILCTEASTIKLGKQAGFFFFFGCFWGRNNTKPQTQLLKEPFLWPCGCLFAQGIETRHDARFCFQPWSDAVGWPGHRRIFQHEAFAWRALRNLSLTLAVSGCQITGFFPSLLFTAALFGASLSCLVTASAILVPFSCQQPLLGWFSVNAQTLTVFAS